MKKLLFSVLLCALCASCSQDFSDDVSPSRAKAELSVPYTDRQVASAIVIYDVCVQFYWDELPDNLRFERADMEQMLRVIRFCDAIDASGDVLCEMCEYEDICDLLWPNGYGVF